MGLLLAPLLIIVLGIVIFCCYVGARKFVKNIKDYGKGLQQALLVTFLSPIFAAGIEYFYLELMRDERIYTFSMFLYITLFPLLSMTLIAALVPTLTYTLRVVQISMFFATLFVIPVAFIAGEKLYPWFNISTHY